MILYNVKMRCFDLFLLMQTTKRNVRLTEREKEQKKCMYVSVTKYEKKLEKDAHKCLCGKEKVRMK